MSRSVTIASGQTNVQLPDGNAYNAGQTVTRTDAQLGQIASSGFPGPGSADGPPGVAGAGRPCPGGRAGASMAWGWGAPTTME